MEYRLEDDYQEGSIMYDYHEAIKDDTFHTDLREAYQTVTEASKIDGSDISHDAQRALRDAVGELERALRLQSDMILRDIAEERSEREIVERIDSD